MLSGAMRCPDGFLCPICDKESGDRIGDASMGGANAGENCAGEAPGAPGCMGGAVPLPLDGDIWAGVAGKGALASGERFFSRNGKILVTSGFMRLCCRRIRSSRNC